MFLCYFYVSTHIIDRLDQDTEENLYSAGKCITRIKNQNFCEN